MNPRFSIKFVVMAVLLCIHGTLTGAADPNAKPDAIGRNVTNAINNSSIITARAQNYKGIPELGKPRIPALSKSGQVIGTYDPTVIQLEGGVVNSTGVVHATSLQAHEAYTTLAIEESDKPRGANKTTAEDTTVELAFLDNILF